jgi:hypothetical protein
VQALAGRNIALDLGDVIRCHGTTDDDLSDRLQRGRRRQNHQGREQ